MGLKLGSVALALVNPMYPVKHVNGLDIWEQLCSYTIQGAYQHTKSSRLQ